MQVRYTTPRSGFEARFESFRITANRHSILTRICVQRCKVSELVLNVIEFVVTTRSFVKNIRIRKVGGGGDNFCGREIK